MPDPYVPAPDITMMEARFTWNGQKVENVFYYDHSNVGFEAAIPIAGDCYLLNIWSVLQSKVTSQITLRELYFTDLTTQTSPVGTYTDGLPDAGNVLTDSVPNNAALVISARTRARGRTARGRNYIPGLAEGLKVGSVWISTSVDPIVVAYRDYLSAMNTADLVPVVLSRRVNGAARPVGIARSIIDYTIVNYGTKSQRNRNPGNGE